MEWGPSAPTCRPPHVDALAIDDGTGKGSPWATFPLLPTNDAEHRGCVLLAVNPQRRYETADEVYSDPAVHGVLHGTDCAISLWLQVHDNRVLDPVLPRCQRLAAGGDFKSINLYQLSVPVVWKAS